MFSIVHAVDGHFASLVEAEAEDDETDMADDEIERFFNGGIVFHGCSGENTPQESDISDPMLVDGRRDNIDTAPAEECAKTPVSDADSDICKKYSTDSLAGGHNTPLADTS